MINRKAPEGSYVHSWAEFDFLPGALNGLALLAGAGAPIVVVTNQRGVALGRMSAADLADIHYRMEAAISAAGGRIDAVYHCPHDVGCHCRKPEIGMFEQAAADLGICLKMSAVIGDQPADMFAAQRIGAVRVLVGDRASADADYVARDLIDAARWLFRGSAS